MAALNSPIDATFVNVEWGVVDVYVKSETDRAEAIAANIAANAWFIQPTPPSQYIPFGMAAPAKRTHNFWGEVIDENVTKRERLAPMQLSDFFVSQELQLNEDSDEEYEDYEDEDEGDGDDEDDEDEGGGGCDDDDEDDGDDDHDYKGDGSPITVTGAAKATNVAEAVDKSAQQSQGGSVYRSGTDDLAVAGDIRALYSIKEESEKITNVGPNLGKPKMNFKLIQESSVSSLIPNFLTAIESANNELKAEKAAGTIASRVLEIGEDEHQSQGEPYIEMNIGLGIFEDKKHKLSSSSDSETSSDSDQDVLGKLMGTVKAKAYHSGQNKKVKIQEL